MNDDFTESMEIARFKVAKIAQKTRFSTFYFDQPILFITEKKNS